MVWVSIVATIFGCLFVVACWWIHLLLRQNERCLRILRGVTKEHEHRMMITEPATPQWRDFVIREEP